MYPRFIEVTCELGDEEHRTIENKLINVDHIVAVSDNIIHCGKDGTFYADESYDELKALIQSAGCAIQKGDPRLDTSKPVPWDELTKPDMIGEPLFNSNTRKWMLLIDSASDNTWIDLVNTSGGTERWIEHDAQKYPLYRMGERK